MPHAFLFDIGNVLLTFDFTRVLRTLETYGWGPDDSLHAKLVPLIAAMEEGQLTTAQFLQQAREAARFDGPEEVFAQAYCDIFTPNEPMIAVVERLAATHPLYLLSNTSALHLDFIRSRYDFFRHFTGGVYSHEAKCLKPNTGIYQQVIEQYNLRPEKTFYIDDLPANTETGQQLGFMTHTYNWQDHSAFERALAELG